MKKTVALWAAVLTACILTGCAGAPGGADSGQQDAPEDSLELLRTVWDSYEEDEKFAVAGGDYSEENQKMDEPGRFSVSDGELLDSALGFPQESVSEIDDAASLMHMMNANTFTCGVYRVKEEDGIAALSQTVKAHILKRQWVCGFPDKLKIMQVGQYLVVVFGNEEFVDTFGDRLMDLYANAVLLSEDLIR